MWPDGCSPGGTFVFPRTGSSVKPDETSPPPHAHGAPEALAAPAIASARTGRSPSGGAVSVGAGGRKTNFADDFRRFFFGGLKTLLPTLITPVAAILDLELSLGEHRAARHLGHQVALDFAPGHRFPAPLRVRARR